MAGGDKARRDGFFLGVFHPAYRQSVHQPRPECRCRPGSVRLSIRFGPRSIHIVDFAAARQTNSMLSELLATADVRVDAGKAAVVNSMQGLEQIEIIRGLNVLARDDRRLHGLNVRDAYWTVRPECAGQIECIQEAMARSARQVTLGDCQFDRTLRSHLAARFAAQMNGVALERRSKVHRVPGSDWLFSRVAREALVDIYEKFRLKLWQRN